MVSRYERSQHGQEAKNMEVNIITPKCCPNVTETLNDHFCHICYNKKPNKITIINKIEKIREGTQSGTNLKRVPI